MSDQIEFVRRYFENLSGKTVSWKDSLQNKIDNLYQVYKGFEILQQEFEADLLRLHTKDQEKSKQLLEITHDIVEHEVDISLNRQNIGLVGDTIGYINNGLSVAEDNLAKNINQTYVLSGSTANMMMILMPYLMRLQTIKVKSTSCLVLLQIYIEKFKE